MAETQDQTIDNTAEKIFAAIDQHGPAMQQRIIREALEDMYTVVYYKGYDYGVRYGGPIG